MHLGRCTVIGTTIQPNSAPTFSICSLNDQGRRLQAPLLAEGRISDSVDLIRGRVRWCETERIDILCCPEAILGGLADCSNNPKSFAITAAQLTDVLIPLESGRVTCIVGFTELVTGGKLYNAAAVFHRGKVLGIYRKLHPAIRHSIYSAGTETRVFHVGGLTLGIAICISAFRASAANCG